MFKSTLYTTVLMAVSLAFAAPQFSQSTSTGLAMWAQCGGIGYTGPTVCAAPGACEYQNDWYSQCKTPSTAAPVTSTSIVPVKSSSSRSTVTITSTTTAPVSTSTSASKVTTSASKSSAISSVAATSSAVVLPVASTSFLGGVNMAGYDFGVSTDGSASGTPVTPPNGQFAHFAAQGVNIFRVPFGWQYMQPSLGGALDSSFFSRYDATVKLALSQSTKPYVILDLHNYARWNGAIVGQGGPTNDQLANVWTQLATKYQDEPRVIFGVMNEPHDVNVNSWVTTVQTVVKAIRAAGATSQNILIPGSTWSHASALPTEAGPGLLGVKDADGSTSKIIFDVHQYLDSDGSGTHTECVTDNVNTFSALATWLRQNGNRKALLSETGGGNTASCQKAFATQLAYLKKNADVYMGYTVWSAGAFDTSYELSVTPNGNIDSALWSAAVKPLL